ncbi:MAG: SDR family NAD(P)-dependent oxidoreductase [Chryseobacterium sp.]|nr:MAG: SDR family NAD(P)-dependent oxidoreductase [Chryseobacterium sp.]
MKTKNNTVLITGGGSGIGLELAKKFYDEGNKVIICGRRKFVLQEAKKAMPALHIFECNLSEPAERVKLATDIIQQFPDLNMLINNAGSQLFLDFSKNNSPAPDWAQYQKEISINLEAPIHLISLFLNHLHTVENPTVINVTSGLAFVPYAQVPIYCATKSGLHSFTLSLRHQLKDTAITILEIVPPAVDTELGGKGLHTYGVHVGDFVSAIFDRLANGENEVGYEGSEELRLFGKDQITARFKLLNN